MNGDGDIVSYEDVLKMPKEKQKEFRVVPNEDMPEVEGMNRHQRRAWFARNKKRLKTINPTA